MSFNTVRIGGSGLLAAQKAMEVTSNNIANASNDNYTRQRIVLGPREQNGAGPAGVTVLGIDRVRDVFADVTWRAEAASAGAYESKADALGRLEQFLGTATNGLTTLLDDFFGAWSTLSLAPGDVAARTGVIDSANALAMDFDRISQDIENEAANTVGFASDLVGEVNELLKQVARLNGAIAQAEHSGATHNELLDLRDAAIDKLSEIAGARVIHSPNGPEVLIGGLVAANGDHYATLEAYGGSSTLNPLRIRVAGGDDVTVSSGRLGGMITVVNTDLVQLRARLDATAMAVKTQVNGQQNLGFDINGNPGIDLFSGTTASDLRVASGFSTDNVAASSTPAGASGNGNNALAMAALSQDTSASSAISMVRTYTVQLGADVAAARRVSTIADDVLAETTAARREAQGVNIDEEMIDLIRYQRAYQASAQAVSVANDILDTLINRMMR